MMPQSPMQTKYELIGGVEKVPLRLVDYDPQWPLTFERHAAVIRMSLRHLSTAVEHIGSTSVPTLPAKPVVDILVAVPNVEDESTYLPQLESAGYALRVRELGHRMLRTPERDIHIHVYTAGDPEVGRCLLFSDRLRTNSGDRDSYAETKRALLSRDWPDMNAYAAAKGPIIAAILVRAAQEER